MAKIGDILKSPETGWKRISFLDTNITYEGSGWYNNQGYDYVTSVLEGACIKFNIKGSKRIRIFDYSFGNRTNNIITFNGVSKKTYSGTIGGSPCTLLYEKNNLASLNSIKIEPDKNSTGIIFGITCIDIDENAEILPYNENIFHYLIKQDDKYYSIKDNYLLLLENQNLDSNNFNTNGFNNLGLLTQVNDYYKINKQLQNNMCEFDLSNDIDEVEMS